jgi:hypothetical protein
MHVFDFNSRSEVVERDLAVEQKAQQALGARVNGGEPERPVRLSQS